MSTEEVPKPLAPVQINKAPKQKSRTLAQTEGVVGARWSASDSEQYLAPTIPAGLACGGILLCVGGCFCHWRPRGDLRKVLNAWVWPVGLGMEALLELAAGGVVGFVGRPSGKPATADSPTRQDWV